MPRNPQTSRFEVGDVICRGNAHLTQAKIIAVQDQDDYSGDVLYTVVIPNKRPTEWSGPVWMFEDPLTEINWLAEREKRISMRVAKLRERYNKVKGL